MSHLQRDVLEARAKRPNLTLATCIARVRATHRALAGQRRRVRFRRAQLKCAQAAHRDLKAAGQDDDGLSLAAIDDARRELEADLEELRGLEVKVRAGRLAAAPDGPEEAGHAAELATGNRQAAEERGDDSAHWRAREAEARAHAEQRHRRHVGAVAATRSRPVAAARGRRPAGRPGARTPARAAPSSDDGGSDEPPPGDARPLTPEGPS